MHVGLVRKCLRSWEPQHRQSSPKGNPQNLGGRGRGMGAVFSRKPAISLKRSKRGPRLPLMTNRTLHTRYPLVPKSMISDDDEGYYALCFKTHASFGAHHENLHEVGPTLSVTKM